MSHEANQENVDGDPVEKVPRSESVLDDSQTSFVLSEQFPDVVENISDGSTQVMKHDDAALLAPVEQFEPADSPATESEAVYEETLIHQDEQAQEEEPTSISRNNSVELDLEQTMPLAFDPLTPLAKPVAGPGKPSPPQAESAARTVPEAAAGASRLMLILLASYASAITIAFLLLLMRGNRQHQLESLPDVIPEPAGQITFVPVDAELPDGHVLSLGSKQRFGNIIVEPLRVTEEPVSFSHYTGDHQKTREPSAPVMKLWIRFTNASQNQSIIPIDRNLLLRWVVKRDTMKEYSNQYVRGTGSKSIDDVVMLYRLPPTSEWDLADQQLGLELAPGESFETYIASTDERLDSLQDGLLWRLQFRKGVSPAGYGVTTLVDIAFSRQDVQRSAG